MQWLFRLLAMTMQLIGFLRPKQKFELLTNMFYNAHAVAFANWSISDFNYLNALDCANGLSVNVAYQNDQACGIFVDNFLVYMKIS